jgi:folate-binding protein YgfZ
MQSVSFARRPRAFVRVAGPDAADYLQRMVSNDVEALEPGESCEALLLTAKARVIAPLRVWRRGEEDFLLLTEPELGETVRAHLLRTRLRARCEIELEEHQSMLVLGGTEGIPNEDYGVPAVEVLDEAREPTIGKEELEALRIRAGAPRWSREIDDRVLPAEAGLDERAVSWTKGCYPGQEPVARLHYRGHPNRRLRRLELEGDELPEYDAELSYEGKAVGRVTSTARSNGRIVVLGYVRVEVPEDAELAVGDSIARPLNWSLARP